MIGEWTLDRYERLLSPQLIISPLLLVAALMGWPNWLILLLEVLWFGGIGLIISRRRGNAIESLVAGAAAGLLSGLSVSLGRWLGTPSAQWGANVVAETLVSAAVGSLLTTVALTLDRRIRSKASSL